jgi:glycosyltransferase involved in cell wall biosynthesis
MIYVNCKILDYPTTGVQRYLLELLTRIGSELNHIKPKQPLSGVVGHAWEQLVLPAIIGKNDILFSPSNTGPLTHNKQVVTLHDVVPLDHPEWLNKRFAQWYRFLTPKLVKHASKIITVSNYSKERILFHTGINPDKIEVVYNCVDSRFCPQGLDEIHQALNILDIPTNRYLLSLGSLEPRKNIGGLLDAWSRIVDRISDDIWLVVVGAKGSDLIFKNITIPNQLKRVHFTGRVDEKHLPSLYSGALAFCYLSIYEGFGLPPLEAMACGTPVLTGNVSSLPEVVGDGGLMVDPTDIDEISDYMFEIIENTTLRQKLHINGQKQAKKFNWDISAKKTLDILCDCS